MGKGFLFAFIVFFGFCFSQEQTNVILNEAFQKLSEAQQSPQAATFDNPLWREAITLGHDALDAQPGDLDALHFLATTYGYINWFSRAWENWLAYFAAGGTVEAADMRDSKSSSLFSEAGTELGFARYERANPGAALNYYTTVLVYSPDDPEALRWAGRIHLELNEPDRALPYWQHLSEVTPEDEGVIYYLNLARQQDEVGLEASRAFQQGLQTYEKGDTETALGLFEDALKANPDFKDAYVWAGRSSFELSMPGKAERYWQRVLELDPGDERAAYFARYSADQARWGMAAARAFYEGQALHLQMNLDAAVLKFEDAFRLNSQYKDAAVWSARTHQELEQPDQAIPYWEAVLELDPDDKRARDFLRLAEAEDEYGIEAGKTFLEGVAAFEGSKLGEAESLFQDALEANQDFAEAWAWLGRIYFTTGDYREASKHYAKAFKLEPTNEGYKFFAVESARLANE